MLISQFALLQQKIGFYLEDIETPIGKLVNLIITGLVLTSSAVFVIETYPIAAEFRARLNLLDNWILLFFLLEYFLRFWCADRKIRYFFSLYSFNSPDRIKRL
jgi:voltage-gated potassium channel